MSVSTIFDGSQSITSLLLPNGGTSKFGSIKANEIVTAANFVGTTSTTSTLAGPLSALTLTATTATPTTNTGTASLTAGLASLGLLTSGSLGSVALPATPNNLNISQFIIGDLRIVYGTAFNTTGGTLTTLPISFDSIPANTLPFQSQVGLFPILGSSLWYSYSLVGTFPTITSTSVTNNNISLIGTFANNSAVSFIAIGKALF